MEEKITEIDVAKRLARKYPAPGWAFLTRVRRGTGYSTVIRTADALAMSLFPSRGFEVHGFEIKVSRNDWKKELSDPEKATELQNFCHRWWIVVPDKEIIVLSEVPKNWGVILAKKNGNTVLKDAPYLEAGRPDYPLLGSIFRNVHENYVHRDNLELTIEERKKQWENQNAYDLKQLREIETEVEKFEKTTGLRISNYDKKANERLGRVVKMVLDMGLQLQWRFKSLHDYAAEIVGALKGMEQEMKGVVEISEP